MSRSFSSIAAPTAVAAGGLPPIDFAYVEPDAAADLLADPGVLALIGFGAAAPQFDDPRWLRLGLEPLAGSLLEVWRARAPVSRGRDGDVRWSHDGDYCWFAIELEEVAHRGIAATAEQAYRELRHFLATVATPHVLRLWNYLDAINNGAGDDERYRQFCAGRGRGLAGWFEGSYPAATAIGRRDGVRVLQIYGLAARLPGTAVENPRQTSAWRYPRQYGATPPTFARAMRSPAVGQLLLSGTAAVVGHASQHENAIDAQIGETLVNLDSLLRASGSSNTFGPGSLLKAYVRRSGDAPRVTAALRAHAPGLGGLLLLAGDICRSELLVEIDGVQTQS
ncbi:MAG TPA: pteridine-dependent deoxygenase [Rhodanobacteraceae bacterium]|nr:pteridine-dependent deoxygenase [Rhodanobacteraceae bacterium]